MVQISYCPLKLKKMMAGTKFSDYLGLKQYKSKKRDNISAIQGWLIGKSVYPQGLEIASVLLDNFVDG